MIYAILAGLIALLLTYFFISKNLKKHPQKSGQKKYKISPKTESFDQYFKPKPEAYHATLSLKDKLDKSIKPEGYQQRNLDREVGGLEAGEDSVKEIKEKIEHHIDDVWDKRSDEIDKIGSIDPLAGHDKESMTWRLKKIRLKIRKHLQQNDNPKSGSGKSSSGQFDSRYNGAGFSQMVKARQDFGHEHNNSGSSR
jgi:hypothetical protein